MRILVLGINYTPEKTAIGPFTAGVCEYVASKGHDVKVITAFPYYPEWRVWDAYRGRIYQNERICNVSLHRVWHYVPNNASNLIQRLAHDFSFALSALWAGLFIGGFDVVYCACPPPTLALTAYALAKIRRKPYVIKLSDLASDAALATGILKNGSALRLARGIEEFVYWKADKVVCLCQAFIEKLTERGIGQGNLRLIPDWGDTQRVYPIAEAAAFRSTNGISKNTFLVMHTGNMGKKQDLLNVVRAAERSKDVTDLMWLLVGQGEERPLIEEAISQRKLKNIRLLPLQPVEGLAEMYSSADVLLLNQKAAVADSVIPSKLLTYMAAGRVVLATVSDKSESARYVKQAQCGLIFPPEDPKALVEAALSLRADPALRERLGANGRAYVQQHFTKDKVLQEYDRLFSRYADEIPAEASKKVIAPS
jgi:colanic acid biosynthesis glycosyl transferase WcaI